MKIDGNRIDELRFQHRGTNVGFACTLDHVSIQESCMPAWIEFQDSREIDDLIFMLQRFKDELDNRYIGEWKERIMPL